MRIQGGQIRDKDRVLNLLCFFLICVAYHVLRFTKVIFISIPFFDMCFRAFGPIKILVSYLHVYNYV